MDVTSEDWKGLLDVQAVAERDGRIEEYFNTQIRKIRANDIHSKIVLMAAKVIAENCLSHNDRAKQALDEIESLIGTATFSGSEQALYMLVRGGYYQSTGNLNEALDAYEKALKFSDPFLHVHMNANLKAAAVCLFLEQIEQALKYGFEAQNIAKKTQNEWRIIESEIIISKALRRFDPEQAFARIEKMIPKAGELGLAYSLGACYNQMGAICVMLDRNLESQKYLVQAVNYFEKVNSADEVALVLTNLASTYLDTGDVSSAESCLVRARENIGKNSLQQRLTITQGALILQEARILIAKEQYLDALSAIRRLESGPGNAKKESLNLEVTIFKKLQDSAGESDAVYRLLEFEKNDYRELSKALMLFTKTMYEESIKNETALHALRSENLEKQLSNSTLQLLAQAELLSELRNDLLQVIRKFSMPDGAARELRERLKMLPCKAVDWEKFDTQFKAAHPEFTKKLLERFPDLTPMQIRISSLLRMNLKSEEIGQLLCLTERNIENHRYRIRKKMSLKREEDLSIYLAKL